MAGPWPWDRWLSLSPTCLCPLLLPLPCPPTQETVAPADNTQQQAHFHKYKASGWGGGRRGRGCPTPLELPPSTPSTQRLWIKPPLSTCSQNSACRLLPRFPWQQASRWGTLSGLGGSRLGVPSSTSEL